MKRLGCLGTHGAQRTPCAGVGFERTAASSAIRRPHPPQFLCDRRPHSTPHAHCRLRDNTYVGTFGAAGWGARANDVLSKVRGKDFRHEKTKKKRGSYRGGAIELGAVNSIKLGDE